MRTELVIFDCDGVLVDSEALGNRVLIEFVAEFGLALELKEAMSRLFILTFLALFVRLLN